MAAIKLFNIGAPVIALDDIVTSYDADHRRTIAGLVATKFSDCQILITTHDERFFNYLKDQLEEKAWYFTRIIGVDPAYGPRFADHKVSDEMIEARWANGQLAANEMRQAEEEWLLDICRDFGVSVRIRPLERAYSYERRELASALAGLLKDIKLVPAVVPGVNNRFLDSLVKGEIENFGSHFQDGPYGDGSIGDEKARWDEFKAFRSQFTCKKCSRTKFKRPFALKKPVCVHDGCEAQFEFTVAPARRESYPLYFFEDGMTVSGPDFRQTWLWRQALQTPRSDSTTEEQDFFRTQYLSIRERAAQLVSRIAVDLPGMTVHDISYLDALWDTASAVAEGAVNVNPAEAFVLGGSILLHDAAMSLAAYPGGMAEVRSTVAWKDSIARLNLASEENRAEEFDVENPPPEIVQQLVPDVLRRLHAERAEELAEQAWRTADGTQVYLVEDSELRRFYGPTIGQIAHSHWWSVQKLEQEFSEDLGALANRTLSRVDRVKPACYASQTPSTSRPVALPGSFVRLRIRAASLRSTGPFKSGWPGRISSWTQWSIRPVSHSGGRMQRLGGSRMTH